MYGATVKMEVHIFCYESSVEIFPDMYEKRVRTKSRMLLEIWTNSQQVQVCKHPHRTPRTNCVINFVLLWCNVTSTGGTNVGLSGHTADDVISWTWPGSVQRGITRKCCYHCGLSGIAMYTAKRTEKLITPIHINKAWWFNELIWNT